MEQDGQFTGGFTMRIVTRPPIVGLLLLLTGPALRAQAPASREADRFTADTAAIREAIRRGAAGFERGDPETIIAHYARDVVLAYPGVPDMDYAFLRKSYEELRTRPASIRARTVPTFDEVLVMGDLAVVRLRWQTTITDTAAGRTTERRMKDLQVWRREPGGQWMFARGMHYREPEVSPPTKSP